MKKFLSLTLFVFAIFAAQAQISDTASANKCNKDKPGFGKDLGTITRGEDVEFAGKIWSGPISASNCQKETFNGGRSVIRASRANFNADCRTNPGYLGDLFSWCTVTRFADTLCPHPWRVPTHQDFKDLMTTTCGFHSDYENYEPVNGNVAARCLRDIMPYCPQGHDYYCDPSGSLIGPKVDPSLMDHPGRPRQWYFWSQSEQSVNKVWAFGLWSTYDVGSKPIEKNMGIALRCVKDK